jgi:hypothetical protein
LSAGVQDRLADVVEFRFTQVAFVRALIVVVAFSRELAHLRVVNVDARSLAAWMIESVSIL